MTRRRAQPPADPGRAPDSAAPTGPRFSVLVPAYNHAEFLGAALDSVLAQSCTDWEVVVVDDGSTDATPELLAGYAARDARIRPIHQANAGVGAALNTALGAARGAWICWLSSDDLLEPDALAIFSTALAQHPGTGFFHSDFRELVHETGELRPGPPNRVATLPPPERQTIQFLHGNYVHGISVCVRRELFARAGSFNPQLAFAQDMDMWLRLSALGPSRFLDHRTCITRVHLGQGTAAFPEGGLLDSARACLDFLNAHAFQDLFPGVDLRSPEGVTGAVQAALGAALNLDACLYAGVGPHAALLERFGEWLEGPCPALLRPSLREGLKGIAAKLGEAPEPLRRGMEALASGERLRFRARDGLELMARQLRQARRQGNHGLRLLLERYLEKASRRPGSPPLREAFLVRPQPGDEAWLTALVAYLEAFRPEDPVGLLLPVTEDGLGEAELTAIVGEVAAKLGLESFPTVELVQGADLVASLRRYPWIHPLPLRPGPATPARRRLAEAMGS